MLGGFFQVLMALALVIILFVIGFAIYNMETVRAIQESGKTRKAVPIFSGVKDLVLSKEEVYDTRDPAIPGYVPIEVAVNQSAGAEFTYNFWMYLDSASLFTNDLPVDTGAAQTTDAGIRNSDIVLFMRGDKTLRTFKRICAKDTTTKTDVLVKCPLVKLERNADILVVELNTTENPEAIVENARDTCSDTSTNWNRKNSHKIGLRGLRSRTNLQKKWFMVSVVIQDTFPEDPLPVRNKIRCRIYINGRVELDTYLDAAPLDDSATVRNARTSVVLQNQGAVYVYPELLNSSAFHTTNTSDKNKLMLADLTYYNYALTSEELKSMFGAGFNKNAAPTLASLNAAAEDQSPILNSGSFATDTRQLTPMYQM